MTVSPAAFGFVANEARNIAEASPNLSTYTLGGRQRTHVWSQVLVLRTLVLGSWLCGRRRGLFSILGLLLALLLSSLELSVNTRRGQLGRTSSRTRAHVLDIISPVTGSLCVPAFSVAMLRVCKGMLNFRDARRGRAANLEKISLCMQPDFLCLIAPSHPRAEASIT